jgi:hypothetical protein
VAVIRSFTKMTPSHRRPNGRFATARVLNRGRHYGRRVRSGSLGWFDELERRSCPSAASGLTAAAIDLSTDPNVSHSSQLQAIGAVELYRFNIDTNGLLVAQVEASGLGTRLSMLDANGQLLIQSEASSPQNGDDRIAMHVVTGSYYLMVQDLTGDGTYALSTRFTTAVAPEAPLPGNSGAYSVATADLTGNKVPDLIVADLYVDQVLVYLGLGDGTFQPPIALAVGSDPVFVTTADLVDNGIEDIITANLGSNNVSILMGNGDGTFQPVIEVPAGPGPSSVAVGDFDGDGHTDLAVTDSYGNDVQILPGNGDGTFIQGPTVTTSAAPWSVVAADFDGDGHTDLAVVSIGTSDLTILRGAGDGTFTAVQQLSTGTLCLSVVAAEFDGDGLPDLAVACASNDTIETFRNVHGQFVPSTVIKTPSDPFDLAAADFTNDGRIDLAVTSYGVGGVSIFLGNGDGTFDAQAPISVGPSTTAIAAADLTGDGRIDLVSANLIDQTIDVLLGNGNGTFQTPAQPSTTTSPPDVVAADLTGNGIEDLIIPDESINEVSILLGRGDGSFRAPIFIAVGKGPSAVAVGDYNGDGIPDLAVTNEIDDSVSILLGVGNGTFTKGETLGTEIQPSFITTADLAGDGNLDLVVSNFYSSSISIFYGKGGGTFQSQVVLPVGNEPGNPVIADLNGDGLPDIAVVNSQSQVTVFLATGPEAYAPALYIPAGPGANALAAGDLAGDGKIDLVVADGNLSGQSYIRVLLGSGKGTFTAGQISQVAGDPTSLVLADLTGDGKLDIVVGNTGGASLSLVVGAGDGTFLPAIPLASGSAPYAIAVADFNGDSRPDIAVADYQSGSIAVLFDTGAGSFSAAAHVSTGNPQAAIVSADFNDDGRLDVAVANPLNNTVTILLGNGDGTFTIGQMLSVGIDPSGLAVGDFNGDGRADLAVADAGSDNVMVFMGLGDGTFGNPSVLPVGEAPTTIVTGDFLDNGVTDIAVADQLSGDVAVLIGQGFGWFLPARLYDVGQEPVGLVAADLSGNGFTDLITANRTSGDLTILWGAAGGNFARQTIEYGGAAPTALAAADFNGDGTIDLAVADSDDNRVSVLVEVGDHRFASALSYATSGAIDFLQAGSIPSLGAGLVLSAASVGSPDIVAFVRGPNGSSSTVSVPLAADLEGRPLLGDFNGDGIPDIAFPASMGNYQVVVRLGSGQGHVTVPQDPAPLPQSAPIIVDWNGDGATDVFDLNEQGQLLLRVGQSNVPGEYASPEVIGQSLGIAFTDIALVYTRNGPVLAAIEQGAPKIWLFSPRAGGSIITRSIIVPGAGFLVSMTAGDLDDDGLDDLVLVDRGNDQLILLYQNRDGSFTEDGPRLDVGYAPSQVAITNLNQSGWPDLVVSNTFSGDLSVFYGGPGRQFGPEVLLAAGLGVASVIAQDGAMVRYTTDYPIGVTAGVFDSSGFTAVVSVQSGSDRISILDGTSDGALADPSLATSYSTGDDPTQVVAATLTDDGLTDLIVLNQGSQNISIFLNNGRGGFNPMPSVGAGNNPTGLAIRDVNGDGVPDLLVSNKQGDLLIILGNGDGTFKPYERADQTVSLAVGDFNSNTQPEYVLSSTSIDQISILYGQTQSFVQDRSQGLQAPGAIAVADLNGDGNPDLIVVNKGENEILVYLGMGGNRFLAPLVYSTGTAPEGLTVADLTGNGVPDLVVANAGSNDLSIFIGVGQGANWKLENGPRLRVGDQPVSTTVADLSGDGIPDIVCVDEGSNNVLVLRGLGGGFFADNRPLTLSTGQSPILAFVGKFDAIPGPDLAVIDSGSNDLTYYSNLLSRGSTATFIPVGGADPIAGVMGDYDDNGYDDLVIADNGDTRISLFEGGPDGLVLTYSQALDQPVRPTGLVLAATAPGQLHLAISAEGENQVISFTLLFTLGAPGSGQGQGGGVINPTTPTSSQNGSAEGSSFATDERFSFELLLAEPGSQEQALVQAATPSSGPSATSSGITQALASVASTVQPMFNPSLGSLPGVISSLVQIGQVQISDLMPLENSAVEAVAVLLVVSSATIDESTQTDMDSLEAARAGNSIGPPGNYDATASGSNLEQFLSDLEGALDGVTREVLDVTGKRTRAWPGRELPAAGSGAFAVPIAVDQDPERFAASERAGPITRNALCDDPGIEIELLNRTGLDGLSVQSRSMADSASVPPAWMRPLCGTFVLSAIVLGWQRARKLWRSNQEQPIVPPSSAIAGTHRPKRRTESTNLLEARASRVRDLPPWLAGPR